MSGSAPVARRNRPRAPALTIAGRDLRAVFGSPFGYGLVAGFLALSGLFLVLALRTGEARLDNWFAPVFVFAGVLCPLLTMRALAEEERSGSLELLVTAPIRPGHLVAGKFIGAFATFAVVVAGTASGPIVVAAFGDPDPGPIATGYIGLVLVGALFLAVGLAASAASASQLVAATSGAGLLLALWFAAGLSSTLPGRIGGALQWVSPSHHVSGFLNGTLDLADVVYFVSLTSVALMTCWFFLRVRR